MGEKAFKDNSTASNFPRRAHDTEQWGECVCVYGSKAVAKSRVDITVVLVARRLAPFSFARFESVPPFFVAFVQEFQTKALEAEEEGKASEEGQRGRIRQERAACLRLPFLACGVVPRKGQSRGMIQSEKTGEESYDVVPRPIDPDYLG